VSVVQVRDVRRQRRSYQLLCAMRVGVPGSQPLKRAATAAATARAETSVATRRLSLIVIIYVLLSTRSLYASFFFSLAQRGANKKKTITRLQLASAHLVTTNYPAVLGGTLFTVETRGVKVGSVMKYNCNIFVIKI